MKYTKKIVRAVCYALSNGVPVIHACHGAGISTETHYRWLKENGEYDILIQKAEALFIQRNMEAIIFKGSMNDDWKANAWLLERRYPTHFAKVSREEIEVSGQLTLEDFVRHVAEKAEERIKKKKK